ncbi:Protein arginine N-methyltransferase 1 [Bienertia sinuspersici]
MGRNKSSNQHEHPVSMNVDNETIEEIGASSNLDVAANDRTSADYYFDSYSHFGFKYCQIEIQFMATVSLGLNSNFEGMFA